MRKNNFTLTHWVATQTALTNESFATNVWGDWISGGACNDRVFGTGGNDILLGGIGSDLLVGGAGDYVINWEAHSSTGAAARPKMAEEARQCLSYAESGCRLCKCAANQSRAAKDGLWRNAA